MGFRDDTGLGAKETQALLQVVHKYDTPVQQDALSHTAELVQSRNIVLQSVCFVQTVKAIQSGLSVFQNAYNGNVDFNRFQNC